MVNTFPCKTRYGRAPTVPLELCNKAYVDAAAVILGTSVVKKIDQTINNSNTIIDDDEVFLPMLANKVYGYRAHLQFISGVTPDLKVTWTVPAGATGTRNSGALARAPADTQNITTISTDATSGNEQNSDYCGVVRMGGTAGNLQLRWAQNVADASDSKMLAGSYLLLWVEDP